MGRCPFHNDRRYCVRGPQKNLSPEFMKVNLLVSRQEEFHAGTLDLQTDRQRAAFIKRALTRIPVLGYGFKLGGFIPVDRSGSSIHAQESVAAARRVLESGVHITTFVEGTRSPDGRMLPFKKGPFYLAKETGAPCIPVSLWGTESMMKKGSIRITPGVAHLVFHPPVYPTDYASREELLDAVRAAIASALPEWMRNEAL